MGKIGQLFDLYFPPTQLSGEAVARENNWSPDTPEQYCGRCGSTAAFAAMTLAGCPHCVERKVAWHGVWRLGVYEPPLSHWIVAYKFQRMWSWGRWLGKNLAAKATDYEDAIVVPVPLHWRRRCMRGYDQAYLIAHAFARAKGLPLRRSLRRIRPTARQTYIHSAEGRKANVRRAFRCIDDVDLAGKTVWLVDDVKTTGATAHACTRLLQRAGAARVNIVVAAVADPKHADFTRTK